MARPPADFAHPVVKTVGCFSLILSLPGLIALSIVLSAALPWQVYICGGVVSVSGLAVLVGRPTLLDRIVDTARDIFKPRGNG